MTKPKIWENLLKIGTYGIWTRICSTASQLATDSTTKPVLSAAYKLLC